MSEIGSWVNTSLSYFYLLFCDIKHVSKFKTDKWLNETTEVVGDIKCQNAEHRDSSTH